MAPLENTGESPRDDDTEATQDTEAYVGLPVEEARRRAERQGWRTVRDLPPDAIITLEYVAARLNFTVRDGNVTRCWKG